MDHPMSVAPNGSYLLCPEFLPAVARLLARAGLPLSALARGAAPAEPGIDPKHGAHHCVLRDALHAAPKATDAAERYVGEVLLRQTSGVTLRDTKDEAPVSACLESLRPDELRRLVVPGAVILAVDSTTPCWAWRCDCHGPQHI